jgi:hypothetical protein
LHTLRHKGTSSQDSWGDNSSAIKLSHSTSSDNLLRFGNGLSFEGSIARRVMDGELLAVSLEVPVVFTVDEDVHTHNNPVSPGYRVFFVTPAA